MVKKLHLILYLKTVNIPSIKLIYLIQNVLVYVFTRQFINISNPISSGHIAIYIYTNPTPLPRQKSPLKRHSVSTRSYQDP